MARPTESDIKSLKTHLTNVWSPSHAHWSKIDTYLEGTYRIWPDRVDRPQYRPPIAAARLDRAVNHKMPNKPIVHRFPGQQGARGERKADKAELWLEAVITDASKREMSLTISQVKRYLLAYGYAVIEGPILDGRALRKRDDEPEQRRGESDDDYQARFKAWKADIKDWNPFRDRAIHPQRVLLHPTEKTPEEALKVERRFFKDVVALADSRKRRGFEVDLSALRSLEPYAEVETIEAWNPEWHLMFVNESFLFAEPNTWGFVPFQQCFSGWGMEPTNLSHVDPLHMAVGLFSENVLETIRLDAQQKSAKHHALVEVAFFRRGYGGGTLAPEDAAQVMAKEALMEGRKDDWWIQDVPNLPQWLFQVGQETEKDLDDATYSRSLTDRVPGVTTVGQQAILSQGAERKFDPPIQQINHLYSILCERYLRMVDLLGEKVTVGGYTIGPEDVGGHYSVECKFQLEDPIMRAQERTMGLQEIAQNVLDPETYLSDTGRENGNEILRRISVYKMLNSEQVQSTIIAAAVNEFQARVGAPAQSQLLGPDGMPLQRQPIQPAQPIQPQNPALQAVQEAAGGLDQRQMVNGMINGVTNAFAPQ